MNFASERNDLLKQLEMIRTRSRALEAEMEGNRDQEQRLIGAIMLCDKVMAQQAQSMPGEETTTDNK